VWLRVLASGVLGLLSLLSISANASVLAMQLRRKPGPDGTVPAAPSFAPFVGGLCGVGALRLAPFEPLHAWWWVPPVVDVGCVPLVVLGLAAAIFAKSAPEAK
jgi:hypothetical protein